MKLGFLPLWRPITSYANLWLRWGLKKSCSLGPKLFNNMWHATYMHIIQGNFWFLMVESQSFNPSFGHNLCCKYSNGSCELILDIHVLISFQWYKKPFNLMNFDLSNCSLKIWESIGILTPKWESTWECVGSFLHTLSHYRECDFWVIFSTHTFLCLCLGCEPKVKVMIVVLGENDDHGELHQ